MKRTHFRHSLLSAVLALSGVAIATVRPAQAAANLCVDGAPVTAGSALAGKLALTPGPSVFGSVPNPEECEYGASKTDKAPARPSDFTGAPVHCARICASEAGTLGGLLSCLSRKNRSAFDQSKQVFGEFEDSLEALADSGVSVRSPADGELGSLLSEDTSRRLPIAIGVGGQFFTIDISQSGWDSDWKKMTAAASGRCAQDVGESDKSSCELLRQRAAKFAVKLKLLERTAKLTSYAKEQAGISESSEIQACSGGVKPDKHKGEPGVQKKRGTLRAGEGGESDFAIRQCENPGREAPFDCSMVEGLDIAPFWRELRPLVTHPGFNVNYIDLLRIRAITQLLKAQRTTVGEPLDATRLPQACQPFAQGIETANGPLTDEERSKHAATLTPDYLRRTQAAASSIQAMAPTPHYINCHHDDEAQSCEINPAYNEGEENLKAVARRGLVDRYPLLAARVNEANDWPAVPRFASASSDEALASLAQKARTQLADAYARSIGRLCDNSNDSNHLITSSDSVSWLDLVSMKGLTSSTVATPPFGVFADMQKCLEEQARITRLGRKLASPLLSVSCLGAAAVGGPFAGVPCMVVAGLMSGEHLITAANTLEWSKECEETSGKGHEAFCTSRDYLDARSEVESAAADAIGTVGMASEEAVRGIIQGVSKIHDVLKLRRIAAEIREAAHAEEAAAAIRKLMAVEKEAINGALGTEVSLAELHAGSNIHASAVADDSLELSLSDLQPAKAAPAPAPPPEFTLSPASQDTIKVAGPVQTEPLGAGGLNDVARLKSPDPEHPTHFKRSPSMDPELWGVKVDDYAVKRGRAAAGKIAKGGARDFSERDQAAYLKARGALMAQKEKYEGLNIAETHWMGVDENGKPLVLQKLAHGDELYKVMTPDLKKIFGRDPSFEEERDFVAILLKQTRDLPGDPGKKVEVLVPEMMRRFGLSESPEHLAQVETILKSPDNVRIRDLMGKLRSLGEEKDVVAAHTKFLGEANERDGAGDAVMMARMPWETTEKLPGTKYPKWQIEQSQNPISLDTNPRNFFFFRDGEGKLQIILFDW